MNEILALIVTAAISFWGSLQLGPVNLTVIQTALAQGKRQALIVATGGALPELFYSALAVWGASFIERFPVVMNIFSWLVIAMLIALGIYNFLKPYHKMELRPSSGAGFAKGFVMSSLNPQLFPFWLGVLIYMKGFMDFKNGTIMSPYIGFVLGTAIGAWLLLFTFTKLAIAYKEKLKKLLKHNFNKIVGILFFILAAVALAKLLFKG